ncbi:MAG: hypothetical protein M0Z53_09400 [Thermaerobacter sp.]|nr:hypothetical protein [Thermaerobacter sp.]
MISRVGIDHALHAQDPSATVLDLLRREVEVHGVEPATVLASLESIVRGLRRDGREEDELALLDAMDRLAGWCRPEAQIF